MKLEAAHVDTCLCDYWGGHHLPHIAIPVYRGITLESVKSSLLDELSQGCVAGAEAPEEDDEQWYEAASAAVGALQATSEYPFKETLVDQEDEDDDEGEFDYQEPCYAFFVFVELDEDGEE